jgi:hypothetical protein
MSEQWDETTEEHNVGPSLAVSHDASHEKYLDVTEKKMLKTGLNEDDEDYESETEDSDTVTQDNA